MNIASRQLLWIDDEIDLLQSHLVYLRDRGYQVTQVTNGVDALKLISDRTFDLVLLDEMMPVMDGLEVLKRIKMLRPDLPVVMVTQNEAEELIEKAIGSQINGYLTKPVNPSQILSTLKSVLDRRELSAAMLTRSWSETFDELSELMNSRPGAEGWMEIQSRLCAWELRIDEHSEAGLSEMLREVRLEADRLFARWVEENYASWLRAERGARPPLSHDLADRWLIPELRSGKPVLFLVIDCLRYDQLLAIEPLLNDSFKVKRDSYLSILPTATPFSRNAIFSGLLPSEIERVHPDLWSAGDEDEGSTNRYERNFLSELLRRRLPERNLDPRYIKVIDVEELAEAERKINDMLGHPITAMVYNFVDILVHTRQSVEVLQEMLPDESALRSVTRAWFQHSALFRIVQAFVSAGGTVILTTDHGSVRCRRGGQVIGDRQTSTGLRYKYGRNLQADPKQVVRVKEPLKWGLPRRGVTGEYVLAREDYLLLFPTNYHKYFDLYRGSFQHGGISLDEMILPVVTLRGRT